MKAHLMFRDRDFAPAAPLPANAALLVKDLELDTLFAAMAGKDEFLLGIAKRAVLTSLDDTESIIYRQEILADSLAHSAVVREAYAIAVEALERERKIWGWATLRTSHEGTLYRSREVLEIFFGVLKRLRSLAAQHRGTFRSVGFSRLFEVLITELDDDFLGQVRRHLDELSLRERMVLSARLGSNNQGVDYVLRQPPPRRRLWERLQEWRPPMLRKQPTSYSYEVHERDESGVRALSELRGRGVTRAATALTEATTHLLGFFTMLRTELAFYVGCLNLRDRLASHGTPYCLPDPIPTGTNAYKVRKLYDVSLSMNLQEKVVANDLDADDRLLIMITGANRGGKSTFLRSLGQAQLMMQCGLFVCAESHRARLCSGLFTHFKREEDTSMKSGKLDEELARMSEIVDQVNADSIVLCNESFGSTNEREGSEIARQIVAALLEQGIRVLYVTHMYELAYGFWARKMETALFLRAERLPDGRRTFRMEKGQPLETSYGQDLYRKIFAPRSQATSSEVEIGGSQPAREPAA